MSKLRTIERRLYERLPIELEGRFQAIADQEGGPAKILNVGPHGFCLQSEQSCTEDTTVRVQFVIEGEDVHLNAKVIWSQKAEDGRSYKIGSNLLGGSRYDEEKFINFYASQLLLTHLT